MENKRNKDIADDLQLAVNGGVKDAVRDIVDGLVWRMIRALRDKSDEVELKIQFAQYVLSRTLKRSQIDKESSEYRLGFLDGATVVCEEFFQNEKNQEMVDILLAKHRKWAIPILSFIYRNDKGWGVNHTELADGLKLSASNLSNHMGYMLDAGVVQASRIGKNRIYSLTSSGKRYIDIFSEKRSEAVKYANVNTGKEPEKTTLEGEKPFAEDFFILANKISSRYSLNVTVSSKENAAIMDIAGEGLNDLKTRLQIYADSMEGKSMNKYLLMGVLANCETASEDKRVKQDEVSDSYGTVDLNVYLIELDLRMKTMENRIIPNESINSFALHGLFVS